MTAAVTRNAGFSHLIEGLLLVRNFHPGIQSYGVQKNAVKNRKLRSKR
jgi:hypothetical protein